MKIKPSLVALVLANLIPLAGVLLWDWEVFAILVLYWLENVIIGMFYILRILSVRSGSRRKPLTPGSRLFLAVFFTAHYGMFSFAHGTLVFSLFGEAVGDASYELADILSVISVYQLGWGILALVVSHGFSFISNYLIGGEGRNLDPLKLMKQPYQRVVVLHLTILLSGFVVTALGEPVVGLVILIAIKVAVDVKAHVKEHDTGRYQPETLSEPPENQFHS